MLFDLRGQIARVESSIDPKIDIYYGSILDCSSLRDALAGCDAVVHLAAYLGVRRTETNKLRCLEINVNGTQNVLDIAIQHRVKKIIFASSSEVYGEPLENPVTEKTRTHGKTVYAVTKMTGEELCQAYAQRYPEFNYTIMRFFNTYGPFQIAQFVIPKFIRNCLEGKPPVVYGDGKQVRSYCYSQDSARGLLDALFNPKADGEVFNIGNSGDPLTLLELAQMIIRLCGKEDKLEPKIQNQFANTDRTKEREIFERFCDTTKAREILGFEPRISTEEGVKQVIETWYYLSEMGYVRCGLYHRRMAINTGSWEERNCGCDNHWTL